MQDVILIKKKYMVSNAKREEKRNWKLRRIPVQDEEGRLKVKEASREERDLEEYHQDLEENLDMRRRVSTV